MSREIEVGILSEWVKEKIKNLEISLIEVEKRGRGHKCLKEDSIKMLSSSLESITRTNNQIVSDLGSWKWFRNILIATIAVILGGVFTAIFYFAEIKSDSEQIKEESKRTTKAIGAIREKQSSLENEINKNANENETEKYEKIIDELRIMNQELKKKKRK